MSGPVAVVGLGAVLPEWNGQDFAVNLDDPSLARSARMMSRGAWLAAVAIRRALEGQGVDPAQTAAFLGVGPSSGAVEDIARILHASTEDGALSLPRFARRGVAACNPLLTFQLMNNFTLCHAAIREGLQGPNGAFFGGAEHALREAILSLDEVPWALAGAADTALHPLCRRERPGVAGEAAVVLLLAREALNPLAWVEVAEGPDTLEAAVQARFGDCGAAAPALGWLIALESINEHQEVITGGFSFRRDPQPSRPRRTRPASRPVITAVGAVTPFGVGVEALWDGLASGQSAIRPPAHLPGFPDSGAVPAGVEVLDPWVPPDVREVWAARGWLRDRRLPWAVAAAMEAWRGGGAPAAPALSFGLGLEQGLLEDWLTILTDQGLDWSKASPSANLRFRAPMDLPARAISELVGCGGPQLHHASACAAGTLAVAQAAAWITRGEADAVLCGAADSMLNPLGLAGLGRLGVISPRGQCRPFDRRRDGISVSEGAAAFLVEREDRALARGARPLAVVLGWGSTQDGHAPTAPRPGGGPARVAMAAALRRANLDPSEIDYINAHGTGTPPNDEAEASAIRDLFPTPPPTGSFKGAFGHAMAAAGALELAGCLMAFTRGLLPGTVGFEREDERLGLPVVAETRRFEGRVILSNSFGFGGQNASLILGRPDV